MRSRIAATIVLAAAGLALAGCSAVASSYPGTPHDHVDRESEKTDAGQAFWLDEGERIAITVPGSSTCPMVGTAIEVVKPKLEGNTVTVQFKDWGDRPCTRDLVPYTTEFWTPSRIATWEPLVIQLPGGSITLPIK